MNRSEITEFRSQLKEITRILNQHSGFLSNLEQKLSLVAERSELRNSAQNGFINHQGGDIKDLQNDVKRIEGKIIRIVTIISGAAALFGIIGQRFI